MAPPATESDIVKALEQRVASLEARVERLEDERRGTVTRGDPCPNCGGRLKLTDERNHPKFGMMGLKVREFTCESCGRKVTRDWDPSKG